MRAEGFAVESILRVLAQQGLQIAARTYRSWKKPARIAVRTVTDALVEDKIRDLVWAIDQLTGRPRMTPEGLYGRRKMLCLLRRQPGFAAASRGAVDRAMRTLGLQGVVRAKPRSTDLGRRLGLIPSAPSDLVLGMAVWPASLPVMFHWSS